MRDEFKRQICRSAAAWHAVRVAGLLSAVALTLGAGGASAADYAAGGGVVNGVPGFATAVGDNASATGSNATAIGSGSTANGGGATATGVGAHAIGGFATARARPPSPPGRTRLRPVLPARPPV